MSASTTTSIRWATKAAQRGYTIAQNVVLFDERISATARLLYIQLAHYAWRNPDTFPTQEEIGANVGIKARQLRTYLAQLEARWLLERHERGLGQPVEYVLFEPAPDHLERDARPPRASKRPVENPGEIDGDDRSSSAIYCLPSSAVDDLPARQSTAEPSLLSEGSEELKEQEPIRLVVGRSVTREEHQRVADTVDNSLRRGGLQS